MWSLKGKHNQLETKKGLVAASLSSCVGNCWCCGPFWITQTLFCCNMFCSKESFYIFLWLFSAADTVYRGSSSQIKCIFLNEGCTCSPLAAPLLSLQLWCRVLAPKFLALNISFSYPYSFSLVNKPYPIVQPFVDKSCILVFVMKME